MDVAGLSKPRGTLTIREAVKALGEHYGPPAGPPTAEKILLFAGRQALLAPDSNGLRVLVRLGLVREETSYPRTYAASRSVAQGLPAKPGVMQRAHLLLQRHGRTLCKREAPRCRECLLANGCMYARAGVSQK